MPDMTPHPGSDGTREERRGVDDVAAGHDGGRGSQGQSLNGGKSAVQPGKYLAFLSVLLTPPAQTTPDADVYRAHYRYRVFVAIVAVLLLAMALVPTLEFTGFDADVDDYTYAGYTLAQQPHHIIYCLIGAVTCLGLMLLRSAKVAAWGLMGAGLVAFFWLHRHEVFQFDGLWELPLLVLIHVFVSGPLVVSFRRAEAPDARDHTLGITGGKWLITLMMALAFIAAGFALIKGGWMFAVVYAALGLLYSGILYDTGKAIKEPLQWPECRRRMWRSVLTLLVMWVAFIGFSIDGIIADKYETPFGGQVPAAVDTLRNTLRYLTLIVAPNLGICLFFLGCGLHKAATNPATLAKRPPDPVSDAPNPPEWATYVSR